MGVLAAYLLVLQAVLTGLALGSTPVAADSFAILCDSGTAVPDSGPEKGHGAAPNCCVAGCLAHGGGMAPPPDFVSAAGQPVSVATETATRDVDLGPVQAERNAHPARAPPARS